MKVRLNPGEAAVFIARLTVEIEVPAGVTVEKRSDAGNSATVVVGGGGGGGGPALYASGGGGAAGGSNG